MAMVSGAVMGLHDSCRVQAIQWDVVSTVGMDLPKLDGRPQVDQVHGLAAGTQGVQFAGRDGGNRHGWDSFHVLMS
jgi:hypothetical protein